MAVIQISRIQHRRGLEQDFPQLASAELGWSLDTRRLFIGNGSKAEGAPAEGVTEILTENSDILAVVKTYTFKGLSSGITIQTGPSALSPIVRTLQDKLDDVVSVKDFGAVGDGVADDTAAIQRAMDNPVGNKIGALVNFRHRTVNFPAGAYRITAPIKIPPYTRLQGEGKTVSSIEGSFSGPLAYICDQFGQVGTDFGAPIDGVTPKSSEYHLNDIQFYQKNGDYTQSALIIDGCYTATFIRVSFRGLLEDSIDPVLYPASDTFKFDRGSGYAGVYVRNLSNYESCKDIKFEMCDFYGINYGIEIKSSTHNVMIMQCLFDHNYHAIVVGQVGQTTDYVPYAVSITDNYFRYTSHEAIYCHEYINGVVSKGNQYNGAGYGSSIWDDGTVVSPVITFNADYNWSIADSIDRYNLATDWTAASGEYDDYPAIETNGYNCYIVEREYGTTLGQHTQGIARKVNLEDAAAWTDANLFIMPRTSIAYNDNVKMDYKVVHNGFTRRGTFNIARNDVNVTWDDEYTETGNPGFELQANVTSGGVEYKSTTTTGNAAVLTYSINYFSRDL